MEPVALATSHTPTVGTPSITDWEFALLQALIYRESGIHLSEAKKALLVRRLSGRLRELGLGSFSAYYRRVKDRAGARERTRMVMTLNLLKKN